MAFFHEEKSCFVAYFGPFGKMEWWFLNLYLKKSKTNRKTKK